MILKVYVINFDKQIEFTLTLFNSQNIVLSIFSNKVSEWLKKNLYTKNKIFFSKSDLLIIFLIFFEFVLLENTTRNTFQIENKF